MLNSIQEAIMNISSTVKYVGVNDYTTDLFEGMYAVPDGMAYNSYVVFGEKIAVMDSVDARFADAWLSNLDEALEGRTPDYLVVHHVEPDHSGSIGAFINKYPSAVIVASKNAFAMLEAYFGTDLTSGRMIVGEGSTLELGGRTLKFFTAPMVHWPEVVVSYDDKDKILFSADAFGKFGAIEGEETDWACEARRYYFGIVGKFGVQVKALLKKLSALSVDTICPLHGPVLNDNLSYYIGLYETWSSYEAESEGVAIAYTSVYGHTTVAVDALKAALEKRGVKVALSELQRCDWAEAVEDAFRYDTLVLATTTYNGGVFPVMKEFIEHLTERNYKNHRLAFIENGTWAPVAAKQMRESFENAPGIVFAENSVKIRGSVSEANLVEIESLAEELANK